MPQPRNDAPLLLERTRAALGVYLARGHEAMQGLRSGGDAEVFLKALQRRDAAFHNFRALEAMLTGAGGDLAQDPETQKLWNEIQQINATLESLMADAMQRLRQSINRTRAVKTTTDAYRSGMTTGPRLVKRG